MSNQVRFSNQFLTKKAIKENNTKQRKANEDFLKNRPVSKVDTFIEKLLEEKGVKELVSSNI